MNRILIVPLAALTVALPARLDAQVLNWQREGELLTYEIRYGGEFEGVRLGSTVQYAVLVREVDLIDLKLDQWFRYVGPSETELTGGGPPSFTYSAVCNRLTREISSRTTGLDVPRTCWLWISDREIAEGFVVIDDIPFVYDSLDGDEYKFVSDDPVDSGEVWFDATTNLLTWGFIESADGWTSRFERVEDPSWTPQFEVDEPFEAEAEGPIVPAGVSNVVYYEDFDDAAPQTLPPGWTGTVGLWHTTDYRKKTSPHSLAYNKEIDHTYETGVANSGTVVTPPIFVPDLDARTYTGFFGWHEIEEWEDGAYDILRVDLLWEEMGVGQRRTIFERDSQDASQPYFYRVWRDISDVAGSTVQLEFSFATVDGLYNEYEGWYVDNVFIFQVDTYQMFTAPFSSCSTMPSDGHSRTASSHSWAGCDHTTGALGVSGNIKAWTSLLLLSVEANAWVDTRANVGQWFTVDEEGVYRVTFYFHDLDGEATGLHVPPWATIKPIRGGSGAARGEVYLRGRVRDGIHEIAKTRRKLWEMGFVYGAGAWADGHYSISLDVHLEPDTYTFEAELDMELGVGSAGMLAASSVESNIAVQLDSVSIRQLGK